MASMKDAQPRRHTQILTFIETDPGAGKDKDKQQLARTHGIRNAFRNRYQSLQDSGDNFRQSMHTGILSHKEDTENGSKQGDALTPDPLLRPAMATIDPFETLPVDAQRLTELLNHHSARQAGEPVFCVNDQIDFRHFYNMFESGMQDPALAHALCLTLKFAHHGGRLDEECMHHRARALQHVTTRLSWPECAATANTIGTILLLVGVEGRLGEQEVAGMHLHGIRKVVQLCYHRNVFLSDPLKRALVWQDLNTSILAGTSRVFSHETFTEIHWHRDTFATTSVPHGFQRLAYVLPPELLEILGDISSLQHHCSEWVPRKHDQVSLLHLDNQQASIESRLQSLTLTEPHPLAKACIYAAYMCAYVLFTEIWSLQEATSIPASLGMVGRMGGS